VSDGGFLNLLSSAAEPADQPGELRWCLVNFLAYFVVAYPSDPCGLGGGGGMLIGRTRLFFLQVRSTGRGRHAMLVAVVGNRDGEAGGVGVRRWDFSMPFAEKGVNSDCLD